MGDFTERFVLALDKSGLSHTVLAERVGVSRSLISQLARGDVENPALNTLRGIAKVLGTTVSYLAGETDSPLPFTAAEWLEGAGAEYGAMARRAYEVGVPASLLAGIVEQLKPKTLEDWLAGEGTAYAEVARKAHEYGVPPDVLGVLVEQLRKK